ncbi:membrane protein [Mangrovibacter sp. MFB070]|uniref:DUF4405 domain-containing protein n=1 Tax=Mangrovibacter sp. MFB070 TaxID=1224318 RepID=UPI0004D95154|nr:DUF4405 domain-containing protein [Mangrovibacter sp. MFB070]KEA51075.1 membrane protein [Mangrovibacter sp. MFB070]
MRKKYHFQVVQDVVLLVMLLTLMGFHLWGEVIHEWLGVTILLLVMLHNALNLHWFSALTQGEYSLFRILKTGVNLVTVIVFVTAIISGLVLSRHVIPDWVFHSNTDLARKVHMTSVHWGQIIIGVHLGMHWKMLAKYFCYLFRLSPAGFIAGYFFPACFICIAIYGGVVFWARNMLPYLLMAVDFAFFDYGEPAWLFYLDYLAVIVLAAVATSYLVSLLLWRQPIKTE